MRRMKPETKLALKQVGMAILAVLSFVIIAGLLIIIAQTPA